MAVLPFGLVVGFTITALPFLLTNAGIPLDRVASVSATVMSPTFWGFLLNPLLDVGLSRRAYSFLSAILGAIFMGSALWLLSPAHLGISAALLLLSDLCIVLFAGAVGGWTAEFVPERLRGAVGGWTNVANLGGGAAGSLLVMDLAKHYSVRTLGLGLSVAIVAGLWPALLFPVARRSSFGVKQVFTLAMRATWQACRRRECLVGFSLFLAPASSVAAINLFSGMGKDFHASSNTVIAVTGAGCAISSSAGSLLGGWVSGRLPRGYIYLGGGIAAAACALGMAFAARTPSVYSWGVLLYNGIAGIAYAAFTALGLQLTGNDCPVAATQLGMFAAATNGAITYMTWLDGQGYRLGGARGLLCTDALASAATAIPLLFLVRRELRRSAGVASQVCAAAPAD
jgi:MFS family permease